ncbi:MAG: hypothetical protein JXR10_04570 [Cyclobacteriaceae bacterium]
MTDPYYTHLLQTKEKWNASSFLLTNQIRDLKEIERATNGKWKTILSDHLAFLPQFNNEAYEFIEASTRLHQLQQFRIALLEETIARMAESPNPYQTLFDLKKTKNAKN